MANLAIPTAPQYVQQAFLWDELDTNPVVVKSTEKSIATTGQTGAPRRNRPPVSVPTLTTTSSVRRGRCEHVGGMLATVLERYGIGIDQLMAEIDKQ